MNELNNRKHFTINEKFSSLEPGAAKETLHTVVEQLREAARRNVAAFENFAFNAEMMSAEFGELLDSMDSLSSETTERRLMGVVNEIPFRRTDAIIADFAVLGGADSA